MMKDGSNPFRVARSADLTDEQIQRYWVEFAPPKSAYMFSPDSPMATIILGGKGSGKTHLLRYHSFGLQALRFGDVEDWSNPLRQDGYIGIYTLLGGLEAGRFHGKGVSAEQWAEVFSYYMELWFAQTVTAIVRQLLPHLPELRMKEDAIVSSFCKCFDECPVPEGAVELTVFETGLREAQHELDRQINDAAFTSHLHPVIRASRGSLIFGFPAILASEIACLGSVVFAYYVDELENLGEEQQRYVNTLLRERRIPTTFRIGARAYGLRTDLTLSADEPLREGSEYELLRLDSRFRAHPGRYSMFARSLARVRVEEVAAPLRSGKDLDRFFEEPKEDWRSAELLGLVGGTESGLDRPHFRRLASQLSQTFEKLPVQGILTNLSCPPYPALEKVGIYLVYKAWANKADILEASAKVVAERSHFLDGDPNSEFAQALSHYKGDFIAQLRRSAQQPQVYAGLQSFIRMSQGLPRAFLTILKYVYSWSSFRGERPFDGGVISIDSQRRGVRDAAEWFLRDMPQAGAEGLTIRSAIDRLGELFRINRYGDKPAECSLIAFSMDMSGAPSEARDVIKQAEVRSLILPVEHGERDRNSKQVRAKFQLGTMICPFFDLPIARRGTARFGPEAVSAIFSTDRRKEFEALVKDWSSRVNAPFLGAKKRPRKDTDTTRTLSLFE